MYVHTWIYNYFYAFVFKLYRRGKKEEIQAKNSKMQAFILIFVLLPMFTKVICSIGFALLSNIPSFQSNRLLLDISCWHFLVDSFTSKEFHFFFINQGISYFSCIYEIVFSGYKTFHWTIFSLSTLNISSPVSWTVWFLKRN